MLGSYYWDLYQCRWVRCPRTGQDEAVRAVSAVPVQAVPDQPRAAEQSRVEARE